MNPYELLDLPSDASHAEIKAAYRKAVKKHHPDIAGNSSNETIILINHAYELLSDPERKQKYDFGSSWVYVTPAPDPREIYKKEFLEKKRAQARARIEFEKKVFQKLFYVNIFISVFALSLIVDQLLPSTSVNEFALDAQSDDIRATRIETERYDIMIPASAELDHTFIITEPVSLECSPIFGVPTHAVVRRGDQEWSFVPAATVYSFAVPFHWVILAFCALTLSMRTFGPVAFSICFAPSILLFFMVTIVM